MKLVNTKGGHIDETKNLLAICTSSLNGILPPKVFTKTEIILAAGSCFLWIILDNFWLMAHTAQEFHEKLFLFLEEWIDKKLLCLHPKKTTKKPLKYAAC